MPFGINTNVAANGILYNLQNTQSLFQTSVKRLSSGLRINSAADDPSGLVISQNYAAQVDGLGQSIKNAQDGVNLVQTAEGALDEVSTQLRAIRTLAIHAANVATTDSAAQQADQAQISSAIATIDRIVSNTQFGTRKLLDGGSGVSVASSTDIALVSAPTSVKGGTYSLNVTTAATQGKIQATVSSGTIFTNETLTFTNGATGRSVTATLTAGESLSDAANAINAATSGYVNISASSAGTTLSITNNDYGSSTNVKNTISTNATSTLDVFGLSTTNLNIAAATASNFATVANTAATTATATGASVTSTAGYDVTFAVTDAAASPYTTASLKGVGQLATITDSASQGYGMTLRFTGAAGSENFNVSNQSLVMQIGAFSGQTASLSIQNLHTTSLGVLATGTTVQTGSNVSVGNINVIDAGTSGNLYGTSTNGAAASDAIRVIDAAIDQVSTVRSQLGSFQKDTLEATVRNSLVAQQNLNTSKSAITDADIAAETLNLSRAQILNQTGIAMLAQANQQPNQLLALFR